MMPVNFFVVRHGESAGNRAKRMSEAGDNSLLEQLRGTHTSMWPLTRKGVEQATVAGKFLNELILDSDTYMDQMFVSSYARAKMTASKLDLIRANWWIDPRISERDWGDLDRFTEEERHEKFGEAIKMREISPFYWRPPGGESFQDLYLRIRDFIDTVHRSNAENVMVVCHGEVMKAFRMAIMRLTPMEYGRMEFSPDPVDRIHNCQVDHYTRRDPVGKQLSDKIEWLQIYRPSEQKDVYLPWRRFERPSFSSFELATAANKLSGHLLDLKL
jgi:broad specificity phosphatase PhoE